VKRDHDDKDTYLAGGGTRAVDFLLMVAPNGHTRTRRRINQQTTSKAQKCGFGPLILSLTVRRATCRHRTGKIEHTARCTPPRDVNKHGIWSRISAITPARPSGDTAGRPHRRDVHGIRRVSTECFPSIRVNSRRLRPAGRQTGICRGGSRCDDVSMAMGFLPRQANRAPFAPWWTAGYAA